MDFLLAAICSNIAEQVFPQPPAGLQYSPARSISIGPNSYQGDQAELRIWRGEAGAHPELPGVSWRKAKSAKLPKLPPSTSGHDRDSTWSFSAWDAMLCAPGPWRAAFTTYLDSEVYSRTPTRRHQGLLQGNPLMLGPLQNCFSGDAAGAGQESWSLCGEPGACSGIGDWRPVFSSRGATSTTKGGFSGVPRGWTSA